MGIFQDMEGLVINCVEIPIEIHDIEIFQDKGIFLNVEIFQDLEANIMHSIS